MRKALLVTAVGLLVLILTLPGIQSQDSRLQNAFRRPELNGWIFVHLQGSARQVGFQHGYLLSPEIDDAFKVVKLELTHENNRDWQFFRDTAKNILWPHVEQEYQDELQGIVEGLNVKRVKMDIWDVVAMNAFPELSYYVNWRKKQKAKSFTERR
jgi:hypothetical protein